MARLVHDPSSAEGDGLATRSQTRPDGRPVLSKDTVLRAAVAIADGGGIDALTMRSLALSLGVEAMSLYHYVANKNDLLDGILETVITEINDATAPTTEIAAENWKNALRRRILAARVVQLRHPWASRLIETRTAASPAVMTYFNALLELLRSGGFSYDLAHHAIHALGSRALGFAQELFDPGSSGEVDAASMELFAHMAPQLPFLVEMMQEISHDDPESTLGWCDNQAEFEFGLDLILDGLERINHR